MATCQNCGNDYDQSIEIRMDGATHGRSGSAFGGDWLQWC